MVNGRYKMRLEEVNAGINERENEDEGAGLMIYARRILGVIVEMDGMMYHRIGQYLIGVPADLSSRPD